MRVFPKPPPGTVALYFWPEGTDVLAELVKGDDAPDIEMAVKTANAACVALSQAIEANRPEGSSPDVH